MQEIWSWLKANDFYANLIYTAFWAGLIILATQAARVAATRSTDDLSTRHKVRRLVSWVGVFAYGFCLTLIWVRSPGNLGVFFGILGAGLALACQEILLCMAGWGLIVLVKPFDIGDRVEIDGHIGDVIDIGVFHTSMLEVGNWVHAEQSTGRLLQVPNSRVFRGANFNYTKGFPFIWVELTVVVTFESDWKRAREILLDQASREAAKIEAEVARHIREMQGNYAIHYQKLTPIVYTSIADHGVALTLRYLAPVRRRRQTEHQVSEGVLDAFAAEARVDLAYPTTRFYRRGEGPAAAGEGPDAGGPGA